MSSAIGMKHYKPCTKCGEEMKGIFHYCLRMLCVDCGGQHIPKDDNEAFDEAIERTWNP